MGSLRTLWFLCVTTSWLACGGGSSARDASPPAPDASVPRADAGGCTGGAAAPTDPVTSVEAWHYTGVVAGLPEGSPTLCDLDHDGRPELIVPMAPPRPSSGRVIVFDGASGAVRWKTPLGTSDFAAPYCIDVDGDDVDDVLVGGRSGDIVAYSGADGKALWVLSQADPLFLAAGNTYAIVAESASSELLFVSKGGGGVPQGDAGVRPDVPGRLMVVSKLGAVLSTWMEPSSAEIYSAPAVVRAPTGELLVALGSGGERKSGSLHLLEVDETAMTLSSRGSVPSACSTGGFVSSPMFGDVTGDGSPDVVDIDYCGTVHVMGLDGIERWTFAADVPFGTANVVLADLTGDGTLDVIAAFESLNFSFPETTSDNPRSKIVALRGTDGTPLWQHDTTLWVFSSPVTADFDGDGTEDVLLLAPGSVLQTSAELTVLAGDTGAVLYSAPLGDTVGTPVVADVDEDGHLDVFFTEMTSDRQKVRAVRLEFCGRPFVPAKSESGFRGFPVHDGYRPSP